MTLPINIETTFSNLLQLQSQIINVIGYIRSVNINSRSCVIFDTNTQNNYTCTYEGFLPVSDTDTIFGYITKLGNNYIFVKKPLVRLSVDRDTIVKSIIKSLKFQINPRLAEKVYEHCLIEAKGDSVEEYLDNMAIDLHEKQIENFGPLPNLLMESQVTKLLRWWYKSRTLRKLYLLGLNNKEIKNAEIIMGMTPSKIYDQCMINPFLVVPIPIDKCKTIFDTLEVKYTEDQVYRATIVRKIFSNNVDKSWIGTPSKYLLDQFRDINTDVMNKLKEEYNVVGDMYTLYLRFHHKVETTMAEVYSNMIKDTVQRGIEPVYEDELTEEQRLGVFTALNSRLSIISGPPGTGKTRIIHCIIKNLDLLGIPYQGAAFTGKAVARCKEVTKSQKIATLHLLISRWKQISPFKFLFIDEASMVSLELIYFFHKTFGYDFQVCLIGDVNQLQPISYGNTFSELINSKCIKPVYLTKNHRCNVSGVDNDLLYNIELLVSHYYKIINRGPDDFIEPIQFRTGNNFFRIEGTLNVVFEIVKLLCDRGIKSEDIMVISPYTKYIDEINRGCQKIFNMDNKFLLCPRGIKWSIGDKIKSVTNNYALGLMNGDDGFITDINTTPGKSGFPEILVEFKSGLTVKFDVTYDLEGPENIDPGVTGDAYTVSNNPTLSLITLAYGCTIHSMQGSEANFIVMYIPREDKISSNFINFNLLYTAMSRAKMSAFLVGDLQMFDLHCVMTPPFRMDNLGQRIQIMCKS